MDEQKNRKDEAEPEEPETLSQEGKAEETENPGKPGKPDEPGKPKKKPHRHRALYIILAVLVLLAGVFFGYTGNYSKADSTAQNVIKTDSSVQDTNHTIVLTPDKPNGKGIIFYPGAKIETEAYVPLFERLKEEGYLCVLIKMPFHMAFFNANAADAVVKEYPEITQWTLSGHSLGGAIACSYYAKNQDRFSGIILLGSYIYGNVSKDKALVLYGSEDGVLSRDKLRGGPLEIVIPGGNHAQFGNYGLQKGDGTASISAAAQQKAAAKYMISFMEGKL